MPHPRAGLPLRLLIVGLSILAALSPTSLAGADISLDLQRRGEDGKPVRWTTKLDPRHVGVVVVDMWNYHWCKTAMMRVGALVPRMNGALDAARRLGMTIMLCPSDVVDNYVGRPQRERIFAMPRYPLPPLEKVECPPAQDPGGCACGPERCVVNYGWDGMHPDLKIGPDDLMPDSLEDVYSLCKERRLTHLIYMGVHTQVCLLGKPMGLRNLKSAGLSCILARDLTDAHPGYDPERQFTPDLNTSQVVAHFERYLAPSVNLADDLRRLGLWDAPMPVDPVRITPWGTPGRPHLFEKNVTVTLSTPWQPNAEIHYTTDGSAPSRLSPRYASPLSLEASTRLRVQAFDTSGPVCLESEGAFDCLPELPPRPDVALSDLSPLREVGPSHTYGAQIRFSAHSRPPQKDRTNEGAPLRLRGRDYARGMGVHAPCQLLYQLEARFGRFVALAGADERILATANGSNVARYPSVVFKVFVDGREAASSPVMRVASIPWRFDVPIPAGAKLLSLCVLDAGDGNREDLANWVDAGFVLRDGPAQAAPSGAESRGRTR
ncbi:MAG: NPCBM/NEW2 domain-containing protein [Isosphaeraceae bacterium]